MSYNMMSRITSRGTCGFGKGCNREYMCLGISIAVVGLVGLEGRGVVVLSLWGSK